MVQYVYAIRDCLEGFGRPFVCSSDAFAKRDFAAAVNGDRVNSSLAFSPADYDLYRLGKYDTDSGMITMDDLPVYVCKGSDLLVAKS